MLLAGIHRTVCTTGNARLQGAGVTWPGRMVRRQRHHSGLWCDVFTTELDAEGGVVSRSLTARKHTLEPSDGLCEPVPDQESGNSFSYLVRGILMDCMATLRQDLHLELPWRGNKARQPQGLTPPSLTTSAASQVTPGAQDGPISTPAPAPH